MTTEVQTFVAKQSRINQRRRLLRPALRAVGGLLCKVDVTGLERIPDSGATILMMNHISAIDPILFTGLIRNRFVISMAKAETLEHWFLRRIVALWGNFVVNRGEVDRVALNQAIELLNHDNLVLIAPEGTRNPNGLHEAKSGTAYIAYKTNAIIVPATVSGAQDWVQRLKHFKRGYAQVTIGKPFRLRIPIGKRFNRNVREAMIREAMYQLASTIPDEYATQRGIYSDLSCATTHYIDFL